MELKECKMLCMKNCSYTTFANLDTRDGGSGCLLWFSELIDVRNFTENGQDIYFRMTASELESESPYIVQTKRNTPITGSSGVLKVSSPRILVLVDHKNTINLLVVFNENVLFLRALDGWVGLLGRLGLFSLPNPEDEAAETEENKSKLELIEKRNFDCNLRPLRVQASCSF
ncbi:hypothetical protein L3X38_021663 [Prunus dulcis]|uniref:Apple domain-containing protein n=1 Tax=Prunus dulcis TaxID=3755 RepID=A0AAD4Z2U1_PRUDU|nr:hypothetical protein L3X38_021663 [Prunus dulcis]